ncbi:probable tRNA methyltransferase 9B [Montipora foliosa]|uniref:probable tRNA methyltransferase 9B n=1 Tax=Montipora foliosa TaxID=591990 RepID=UPI0035F216ED
MNKFASPEELEKHHVRNVYEKIAPHFLSYRPKAWPRVEEFLLSLPAGSLIADVGCGTGKYLGLALESFVVGSDSCVEFTEIAAQRGHNVVACDNQSLPFRDGCFDAIISVGVIHHFASEKRRVKALEELYRILRPGGRMLVYVWAFEQEQRKFDGKDVLVPYTHYQRNKVLVRRSMSTPVRPRLQTHFHIEATPNMAAASLRSQRANSSLDSCVNHMRNQQQTQKANRVDCHNDDTGLGIVHVKDASKYSVLQRIRNQESVLTSRLEVNDEGSPVKKLSKFLNSIIKRIFDDNEDDESEKRTKSLDNGKGEMSGSSADTSSEIRGKLSALRSYFSAEKQETNSKAEFLVLLARKFFAGKDDLRLDNAFDRTSVDCKETGKDQHEYGDVMIGFKEEKAKERGPCGDRSKMWNDVSLGIMARLVDSLGTSVDVVSDSSSSGDEETSDESSSTEDWDGVDSSIPTLSKKTFQHTTISCQEPVLPVSAADLDSQYSSSLSSFSSASTSSSSCCPSPTPSLSSSSSSPRTATSPPKRVKRKLQRYYHVFCAGELARLVQDGIPSAVVLKEYYDHGNWAVILKKTTTKNGHSKTL